MSTTFDLSTLGLEDGTYSITVVAKGVNLKNSPQSDAASYTVQAVSLISFTIEGTSYQAEPDMTWEEWIESDYNTSGSDWYLNAEPNYVHIWDVEAQQYAKANTVIKDGGVYEESSEPVPH